MSSHSLVVDLYYGGSWHNATSAGEVYAETVTIKRYGSTVIDGITPGEATFVLKGDSGKYNTENPLSPIYGLPNVPIRITVDGDVRWTGQTASWIPGRSVSEVRRTSVTSGGVLRRLGIGKAPLVSAIASTVLSMNPIVYIPCNDGSLASIVGSAVSGCAGAAISEIKMGEIDGPIGDPRKTPEIASATKGGFIVETPPGGPDTWTFEFCFWLKKPTDYTVFQPIIAYTEDGVLVTTMVWSSTSPPGVYASWGSLSDTPISLTVSGTADVFDEKWHSVRLVMTQSGSTATLDFAVDGVTQGTASDTVTPGPLTRISFETQNPPIESASVGHVFIHTDGTGSVYYNAVNGFPGERSGNRFYWFCNEQGITRTLIGTGSETSKCGPQTLATVLEVITETAVTDGGIVYEATDGSLTLRSLISMYRQGPVALVSVEGDVQPELAPVVGDQLVRNDVTASRPNGSSARYQVTGVKSPTSIGRYDGQFDTNPQLDTSLADHAAWAALNTTIPGPRWPVITLDMDTSTLDPATLEIGTVITLRDVPAEDDPRWPNLIITGVEETITPSRRTIRLLTAPADLILGVGMYDSTGSPVTRYDAGTSTLSSSITSTATSLSAAYTGARWCRSTDSAASLPYDILIGGERMTVTAVTGTSSPQTMTVTRSINGVVKAHSAGDAITLAEPAYYGR